MVSPTGPSRLQANTRELMNKHRARPAIGSGPARAGRRRVLGDRRARLGLVGVLGAIAVLAIGVVGAFAVHDVGFQLEGNATAADTTYVDIDDTCPGNPVCTTTRTGSLAGVFAGANDWDSLFTTDANGFGTERASFPSGFEKADFVVDFGASGTTFLTGDDTTFSTGSKDTLPINLASGSDWQCNHDNNVNSKIDIINGYAANYVAGGEKYIFFGLEKDVDNGSNNVGLWLFQDRGVGCSAPVGSSDFSGHHSNGDLLLVSEFSNGGGVSTIQAYQWVGDDTGHLDPNPVGNAGDCLDQNANDSLCAVINGKTITMPWKSADSSVVNAPKVSPNFFEGGINLSDFPAFADRCFSGFMLTTRSSPSLTATIFDYVLGSIDTCDARISVTPNGLNEVGQSHTFTVTVEEKSGASYVPAAGETVTATLAAGSVGTITGGTCTTTVTDVNGQCTVIVNSAVIGSATLLVSSDINVQGSILTRDNIASTPAPQGTGATNNNVKTWVDGNIAITPSATNPVGQEHVFTITANALGTATPTSIAITPSVSPAPSSSSNTCATPTLSNGGKTATCTVTINSTVTGVFTANASVVFSYTGGLTVTRDTDPATATIGSGPDGSGPATKTYVDARITIATSGTNKVGDAHTFTVTIEKDLGDGAGWVPAAGVNVLASESGVGTITGGTCDNAGGDTDSNGQCTIIVNSNASGQSTVNATATVSVGGVNVGVSTTGHGAHDISNVKTWVNARITIQTSGTNKVGDPHTFTVTVEADNGSGFAGVAGANVLASETGVGTITGGTCDNAGGDTDANGQCTIIVSSNAVGQSTVNASTTITVNGVSISLATDGAGAHDISNVKTWVDARITIQTSDTNGIGESHTFTVTVEKNLGLGGGWVPAAGVNVDASETGIGSITGGTCDNTGGDTNSSGECTVIVNSNSAGQSTVNATATVAVSGVNIGVSTTGYGAHDISNVKTWVDGSLTWLKRDNNGQLLGGATFEVCRTHDRFGNDIADECVTVVDDVDGVDDTVGDRDGTPGEFKLDELALGRYTITETVAPPTYTLDTFVETIELTLADPDKAATHIWINTPGGEGCTPGYWKTHTTAWDQLSDPAVDAMPAGYEFTTSTSFNDYFNLTSAESGFSDSFTMLDATGANGGGAKKLARHGVSALLNVNSVNYPIPASIDTAADDFIDLYNAIRNAYLTGTFEPLATQLADNNNLSHQNCPT